MIKNTARFISIAALFIIPFFALLVVDTYFFPFITGKAFYFRILVEIAFAGWLILALLDANYRPKLTPLTIGVTLFAAITLVADLVGVNPIRSMWSNFERMEGWITVIHLWAFFIAATGIFGAGEEGKRLWHRWINVQLAAALWIAIHGILQLMGKADIHQGSTRIDASLGNAAYMAVYMLWNTGLAAYMFLVARAKRIAGSGFLQWAYPILGLLFAYELFETATRGTILGLVGGIMLACFLYAVLGKNERRGHRWSAVAVIVFLIVAGVVLVSSKDSDVVKNNETLTRLATISWSGSQGQARSYIWPIAIKGFTERPILGWGQENFNYVFNANYDPLMWNQEQWFDRAHSVYLDWLIASGLLGLLAYLALYILSWVVIWRSTMTMAEKSVLTGLIVGYAIHNVFVFDNIASYILFFAALAFVNTSDSRESRRLLGERVMSSDAIAYVGTPAVVILLIAVMYFFSARPMQANTGLIQALSVCNSPDPGASTALFEKALDIGAYVSKQEIREQILTCSNRILQSDKISGEVKQASFNLSKEAISDQLAATRFRDARSYVLAGSFMNMLARFEDSLPFLEQAHALSPAKQSITVEYATALVNVRQMDKAIDILKPAFDVTPANPYVRNLYALALVAAGREAEARKIFADDPGLFDGLQMAQAYTIANQPLKAIAVYRKVLEASPNDINASVQMARLLYTVGQKAEAIQIFRNLQKAYPEYKDALEAAIQAAQQ